MSSISNNPTKTTIKTFDYFLRKDLEKFGCNKAIHGHTHDAKEYYHRIDLGSWGYYGDYYLMEIGGKNCLFLSDTHLGDLNITYDFEEILKKKFCVNIHKIFLVGDIFDLWVENEKRIISDNQNTINLMEKMIKKGIVIYYIKGNHDKDINLIQKKLLKIGVIIIKEQYVFIEEKVLIKHGHQWDISSSSWYVKLFYAIWLPLGDNLYFLGKLFKKPFLNFYSWIKGF